MQLPRIPFSSKRFKRQFLSQVGFARFAVSIGLIILAVIVWKTAHGPVSSLLNTGAEIIQKQQLPSHSGRTNFLILGRGGEDHDGPDLTDTIILASVKTDTGDITLISIPRDLWVSSRSAKINSGLSTGIEKQSSQAGILLAKSDINEVTGQPIDFVIVVDFSAFTRAIDILGGIDITVDRTFDDNLYPIAGLENAACGLSPAEAAAKAAAITSDAEAAAAFPCRYERLHFTAGLQHMDGATALKYVRSRHSADPLEGNDYARSRRQEKVISAIKTKLTSINNLTNSQVYKSLYQLAKDSLITDIAPQYYQELFLLGMKARQQPITTFAITEPDQLYNPPPSYQYGYAWILLPNNNDYKTISDYINSKLYPYPSPTSAPNI